MRRLEKNRNARRLARVTDQATEELLGAWRSGDREALDHLVVRLHKELRAISGRLVAREGSALTLQPTAVVHEAYLRFVKLQTIKAENRQAFLGFAARVMRNVLVEFARSRRAKRRGGNLVKVAIDGVAIDGKPEGLLDMIALDEALKKLEGQDERLVRQVELRFFSGMNEREVAEALGVSRATVQRDWVVAKRWLARYWLGLGGGS